MKLKRSHSFLMQEAGGIGQKKKKKDKQVQL